MEELIRHQIRNNKKVNNTEIKEYVLQTRDLLKLIIKNKSELETIIRQICGNYIIKDFSYIDKNIKLNKHIDKLIGGELTFRYLYDISKSKDHNLLINRSSIGKLQCLADTGIFILTYPKFSNQFKIDLIEYTNISGFLSDQPLENLYVNQNKIETYLNEFLKTYKLLDDKYIPKLEVNLLKQIYNAPNSINEYVKYYLATKMLFEKDLTVLDYDINKFYEFIKEDEINNYLDELNSTRKEVEEFFPIEKFIN